MQKKDTYKTFEESRDFVHKLKLKSAREWHAYCISGKKPDNIPADVRHVYKNEWNGFEDWLGYTARRSAYRKFRPFTEARTFARSLKLKSVDEWRNYFKSGKKPDDIPTTPNTIYKKEWKDWGDWLGYASVDSEYGKFMNFQNAKEFVRPLKLWGSSGWRDYCESGKKPDDIPAHPEKTYKKEWKGWIDWTGVDPQKSKFRKLRPFIEARDYVRKLGLKSVDEWNDWKKLGVKPDDIPATPGLVYKKEWKGFGDWLGTNVISHRNRKFRPFTEARTFARSLKLISEKEWKEWCKNKELPSDIPAYPRRVYNKEWKGVGDWLGTGVIAHQNRKFRPFTEARTFARSLKLQKRDEWSNFCKSGKKPDDIPSHPSVYYKDEFIDMTDWLGIENSGWPVRKIKELLKDLIDSGIIYQWNDAVLYSFLLRKGLLNLGEGNRHNNFFKNLLKSIKTPAGRDAIEDYVNSSYEEPPDFSKLVEINELSEIDSEIELASSDEIAEFLDDTDPLDYADVIPVEDVLRHTDSLESINIDEEAIKFYVNYSINQIWKNAFKDESDTLEKIHKSGLNGNKYHDEVVQTFLDDYEKSLNLEIPEEYSFPEKPLLMQKYVAYKILTNPYFGNFSGTGAGKTLSAILSSRVIDSKLTLVVCPNDVVSHWEKQIMEIFPDSEVITGKDAFFAKRQQDKHLYAVVNYDKFNQPDSPNLLSNLSKEKIDFVVLDEIHFSKIRDANVSLRRQNLDGLMTEIRIKNPLVKTLGVSATPVVNNLQEGRSLIELITGKVYDDVATRATIPNAVTLYEKLSNISVREMPDYPIHLDTQIIDVEASKPDNIQIKQLKSNPLSIEQILTDARLPEIIKLIDGQTIIYTEYVEEIVEKISNAVRDAGYSFALFTGSDHSGLSRFLNKKIQVLIASRPISTGIDGLQHICNRLIINTLPWTNAQYQQLLGRLVRRGQIKDIVNVYVIKASIGGYPYDQLKLDRIKFKKTLADCAVDGTLPEKNLITPSQATAEAVKWLERLERGEISTITRRDLNVQLSPVQVEQRITKYGDFEKFNQRINTEKSETTHLRMLENPEEWLEYHRQYREARTTWSIIPFEHWISRLNRLSQRLEIGDFGCGEAKIQEAFGERVHSFDHVAINEQVTACDITSVPLEDGSLDVVIFSLSLMGKNWNDYLKEAHRCLASNQCIFISETTRALEGRLSELRNTLKTNGFEIYDDFENGNFTFIEARKL
ncbi:MAG TPA: integrase repeat-containing protein [Nitrosarchaeum sp.]